MKKKICYYFMLAFWAIFAISCSESEELRPTEESPETRANSPFLTATPTEVYFNDVHIFDTAKDTVNIKTSGLPSFVSLTRLDMTIQGPDKDMFKFTQPDLDLEELLDALLGEGIDIPVSYMRDPSYGPHEAELLVTVSLLGVLLPTQITIPLHGAVQVPVPKLIRTIPEYGGTVAFEGKVSGVEYLDSGQYHLHFIFDSNIRIAPFHNIGFSIPFETAVIRGVYVTNGNTLSVRIWEPAIYFPHRLYIGANSVLPASTVTQEVGNEEIFLNYSATGRIPDNYVED